MILNDDFDIACEETHGSYYKFYKFLKMKIGLFFGSFNPMHM